MDKKLEKKGSIEIIFVSFFVICLLLIFSTIFLLYTQINSSVYRIKQDISYIVQNAYMSFNNDELAYFNYVINEDELKSRVNTLITKNYTNVELQNLYYDKNNNVINIEVLIKVKPVIFSSVIGDINLTVKDGVKLKLMDIN